MMGRVTVALSYIVILGSPAAAATAPAATTSIATWVSNSGVDSGNCNLAAPCRTFQYAHDQTSAGGEIDVKDVGRFGALTVTKAISIVAAGAQAGMTVQSGGIGIDIKAGTDDLVLIRGLTIDGHGLGMIGINVTQARHVIVQDCVLQNMTDAGLAASSNSYRGLVSFVGSVSQNNNVGLRQFANGGLNVTTTALGTSIVDSKFIANRTGVYLRNVTSSIAGSIFQYNTVKGVDNGSDLYVQNTKFFQNQTDDFGSAGFSFGGNTLVERSPPSGTLQPQPVR
jgi:hypothetical protein